MFQKHLAPLTTFLCVLTFNTIKAQEITLNIKSKDSTQQSIIESINYNKIHSNSFSILKETNKLIENLHRKGYFNVSYDSIINPTDYTYILNLGTKVSKAIINDGNLEYKIAVEELEPFLKTLSEKQDLKGRSFSETHLFNISIKNNTLYAHLKTNNSKKRQIDSIIIMGYKNFPRSFLKNYFNINHKTILNRKKLSELSTLTHDLEFVKEQKSPQVLFTKDSTLLYLYLQKVNKNYFDGLISISTKNNQIRFNGHLLLNLKNILDTGESFRLTWNSTPINTSFNIDTEIPYIFNTPITPSIKFNIYKQDSSFLSTEYDINLLYNLSSKSKTSFGYSEIESSSLQKSAINSLNFNSYFLELGYQYKLKNNFKNDQSHLSLSTAFGKRKSTNNSNTQVKLGLELTYHISFNNKSKIKITSKNKHLDSESYLDNELFRLGGNETIRGFLQESILASSYIILQNEYQYLLNKTSLIYPLLDLGIIKHKSQKHHLLGIGIGYSYTKNNTFFNIEYSIGKMNSTKTDLNQSLLSIKVLNFF